MKVLFIGLGGIGQRHLRNLQLLVGTNLQVLAYRELNRGQVINERLGIDEGADLAAAMCLLVGLHIKAISGFSASARSRSWKTCIPKRLSRSAPSSIPNFSLMT